MLIEAAKGGHTTVVQMLIDYPNSLVTPSVVEQVGTLAKRQCTMMMIMIMTIKMLSSMLTCLMLRAGACCRSLRAACRPLAVRAGAGPALPSPSLGREGWCRGAGLSLLVRLLSHLKLLKHLNLIISCWKLP